MMLARAAETGEDDHTAALAMDAESDCSQRTDRRDKHLLGEQRNKLAGMAGAAQNQTHALTADGDAGGTDALAGGELADGMGGLGRADELLVTNWTN